MTSSYPGALDSFSNPSATSATNDSGLEHDVQHANANDAIEAIETELGTDPAGSFSTVKERLDNRGFSPSVAIGWGSGTYLSAQLMGDLSVSSTTSTYSNMIHYSLWGCHASVTLTSVAMYCSSRTDTISVRIGLYEATSSGPGSLIADFGQFTPPGTGWQVLTVSQAVVPGFYWFGVLTSTSSASFSRTSTPCQAPIGSADPPTGVNASQYRIARSYSLGLPDPASISGATEGTSPWMLSLGV